MTLQFLGPVGESATDSLTESVAESVRRVAPFTLARRWGRLPVAAAGVGRVARRFERRQRARRTRRRGQRGDRAARSRRRRPSLPSAPYPARANVARDLRVLVEHLGIHPAGPPFIVHRVALFDSDTRADGAVHTERRGFALAAEFVNVSNPAVDPERTERSGLDGDRRFELGDCERQRLVDGERTSLVAELLVLVLPELGHGLLFDVERQLTGERRVPPRRPPKMVAAPRWRPAPSRTRPATGMSSIAGHVALGGANERAPVPSAAGPRRWPCGAVTALSMPSADVAKNGFSSTVASLVVRSSNDTASSGSSPTM